MKTNEEILKCYLCPGKLESDKGRWKCTNLSCHLYEVDVTKANERLKQKMDKARAELMIFDLECIKDGCTNHADNLGGFGIGFLFSYCFYVSEKDSMYRREIKDLKSELYDLKQRNKVID